MKSSLIIAIFCLCFVLLNIYTFFTQSNNISLIMAIVWLGIGCSNLKQFIDQKKS